MHVYFYMTSCLLHAPRSYPFLDRAFYCHTLYKHDTANIQHMHRYDTYIRHDVLISMQDEAAFQDLAHIKLYGLIGTTLTLSTSSTRFF